MHLHGVASNRKIGLITRFFFPWNQTDVVYFTANFQEQKWDSFYPVLPRLLPFFRSICFNIFALSGNNRENWTEDLWKYPNYKLEKLCIRP